MKKVSSLEYDSNYYLHVNDGWSEFGDGKLSVRMVTAINEAGIDFKGKKVLDIGCGRGELCDFLSKKGAECVGIDYSSSAIKIAKSNFGKKSVFKKMDCTKMDFQKKSFDAVFMMDIVEHLTPEQLEKTISLVYSFLKPGGFLMLHTMPNAFLAKPFYLVCKITGTKRGVNEKVHINEQTIFSLKKLLGKFENRFFFAHQKNYFKYTSFYASHKKLIRPLVDVFLVHDFSKIPFLNIFLASEIFSISKKPMKRTEFIKSK
jgi:2-polyprenyl-3-methyl-5-hydroxy-6-metoxy-1,4-benzoquinol methylase